ncbi:MAG: quinoprotein dehydrogenase-associated putative ABC transporter substrate-binding protein [Proteobacteria bacterium]|nr:quinoprotein dehydrogenase-associated putative ABC transporter substrate-binding protein [Pseudomonadota bacterium]
MRLQKLLLTGLTGLLLVPAVQAWEGETFKVCADPNNPPYSDQKKQGFENKIAELFGKQLGKKVEYTWFPQRMGFIRNTLKAQLADTGEFKCDVIIGYPTGADMAATTNPYYHSTYALVYVKKRGFDDIKSPDDLANLTEERKAKLKLAMFDASPATDWLLKHNLVAHAIPYQTMTGDASVNTAERLEKDMKEGKLDMAIVWGPIAGWLQYHDKIGPLEIIPMRSEQGIKFDFPMSMAVRIPDKGRKEELNGLIESKRKEISKILMTYHVPLMGGE